MERARLNVERDACGCERLREYRTGSSVNFAAIAPYLNVREEQSEEGEGGCVDDVDERVPGQHAGAVGVVRRGPRRRRVHVEVCAAEAERVVTVTSARVGGLVNFRVWGNIHGSNPVEPVRKSDRKLSILEI